MYLKWMVTAHNVFTHLRTIRLGLPEVHDPIRYGSFEFLLYIHDFGELLSEFESGERVRYGFDITNLINQLLDHNYFVFGAREIRIAEGGRGAPSNFPIAIVYIRHKNNTDIEKVNMTE